MKVTGPFNVVLRIQMGTLTDIIVLFFNVVLLNKHSESQENHGSRIW